MLEIRAWRKPTANTRPREHLTGKKSHYMIASQSISFQISIYVLEAKPYFALLAEELFHKKKAFCHPIVLPKHTPKKIKKSKLREQTITEALSREKSHQDSTLPNVVHLTF